MALRVFRCPICQQEVRTLKATAPVCLHFSGSDEAEFRSLGCPEPCEMEVQLQAPETKFMETTNPERGKSKLKNQHKILLERSRTYARDYEADELIQRNRDNGIDRSGFLRKDGKKRGKIDDI